jgi:hypothetical protein
MPKTEPQWLIIIIGGKRAEFLGTVAAPDADAASKAADQVGVTDERRKRIVAQPVLDGRAEKVRRMP